MFTYNLRCDDAGVEEDERDSSESQQSDAVEESASGSDGPVSDDGRDDRDGEDSEDGDGDPESRLLRRLGLIRHDTDVLEVESGRGAGQFRLLNLRQPNIYMRCKCHDDCKLFFKAGVDMLQKLEAAYQWLTAGRAAEVCRDTHQQQAVQLKRSFGIGVRHGGAPAPAAA